MDVFNNGQKPSFLGSLSTPFLQIYFKMLSSKIGKLPVRIVNTFYPFMPVAVKTTEQF